MGRKAQFYTIFETEGGFCGIAWNETGIVRFQLPSSVEATTERNLLRRLSGAVRAEPAPAIAATIDAVRRYFSGEEVDFSDVALDLEGQEDFFREIYERTRQIAWGRTTTYGALARELGAGPEVARDVGVAMARNPVALIIPCHRVLAAGGRIGGFSAPGGASSKARMLELEGVRLTSNEPAQQAFGF